MDIGVFVLSDDEIDHSESLVWSRVQQQRVEDPITVCIHGIKLAAPCAMCYSAHPQSRVVLIPNIR